MLRFLSFLVERESIAKSMQTEIQTRNAFNDQLDAEKARTGKDHVVIHFNGQEHHITHMEDTPRLS